MVQTCLELGLYSRGYFFLKSFFAKQGNKMLQNWCYIGVYFLSQIILTGGDELKNQSTKATMNCRCF